MTTETMEEAAGTYPKPAHGWTCFHCGETFTTEGAARDHFGANPLELTGCQIKAGEERGLLMALRKAQDELARYRNEDSDMDRKFYAMQAEHRQALMWEEEKGYARGLADGRAEALAGVAAERERAATVAESMHLFADANTRNTAKQVHAYSGDVAAAIRGAT